MKKPPSRRANAEPTTTRRRDRILDAATRVFARSGFHAASVPAIAREAGVSVGLLYVHFRDKAALAVAIVERDRQQTVAALRALATNARAANAALRELALGWVGLAMLDRAGAALVAEIGAEATRNADMREVVAAADAEVLTLVTGLVARAVRRRHARPLAMALVSALDGLVARAAIDQTFDPRPAARALCSVLVPRG